MSFEVVKGVGLLVGTAVLTSVLAGQAPKPPHISRPSIYAIAADAEAERTQASANFSVTWIDDRSSPDAPSLTDKSGDGVPDAVQRLLDAFEVGRAFLLNQLHYREPPTSGPYRIYVAGVEGPAVTKPLKVTEGLAQPAFTVIPASGVTPRMPPRILRQTAVHEYFHAIQMGYDSGYDHWLGEASAAWVEDVFDDGADPNHHLLRGFVPRPRQSLTDVDGQHEYGAFLFIQFLVERYGGGNPGIVREVWETIGGGSDAIQAIDTTLARRGVTLANAWTEFQLWRWDLDRFEEGAAYQRVLGAKWPRPLQNTEVANESCRLSSDLGSGLPPLSGDYSVFRPARQNGKAVVTVEGGDGSTAFVLVEKQNGKERVQLIQIGDSDVASANVRFGGDQVKRVVLGVGNPSPDAEARFSYSLRVQGRDAVTVEPLSPPADTSFFGGLTLRGHVLCNGQPAGLADVVLVQDKASGEQRTFPLTTGPTGTWMLTFEPEQTSTYQAQVVDPLLSPASSSPWGVGVRVAINLEVPEPEAFLGEQVNVQGKVTPSHQGALVAIEYRRPDLSSWQAGPQVTVGADGVYQAGLTLPGQGIWHLRATVLSTGDQDHLGASTVNDVFVTVR